MKKIYKVLLSDGTELKAADKPEIFLVGDRKAAKTWQRNNGGNIAEHTPSFTARHAAVIEMDAITLHKDIVAMINSATPVSVYSHNRRIFAADWYEQETVTTEGICNQAQQQLEELIALTDHCQYVIIKWG